MPIYVFFPLKKFPLQMPHIVVMSGSPTSPWYPIVCVPALIIRPRFFGWSSVDSDEASRSWRISHPKGAACQPHTPHCLRIVSTEYILHNSEGVGGALPPRAKLALGPSTNGNNQAPWTAISEAFETYKGRHPRYNMEQRFS